MFITVLLFPKGLRRLALNLASLVLLPLAMHGQTADVKGTMPEDYLPGLKALLEVAVKQSPQMLSKNIDVAQSAAGRYSADAGLWPSLSGYVSYSYSAAKVNDAGVTGPTSVGTGLAYGASLSQSLFQWGAVRNRSDIGKISLQIAERQYADAYRSLVATLRGQYLAVVAKKIALRNGRAQLDLLKKNLAVQEANLKEGSVSEGEIISPRLAVLDYQLTLDRAEQEYVFSKQALMRISGFGDLSEASIPDEMPRPTFSAQKRDELIATFRRGGVENTLQGQVYALYLKQRDKEYKIARTGLYPKFSFSSNYGLSNSQSVTGLSVSQSFVTSYGYSVTGSWTLFDGFATRGAKLSSLATKRSTEQQFQSYIDTTIEVAENMQKQLEFTSRALDLAETRRVLAEDAVKRATQELSEGSTAPTLVEALRGNFNTADFLAVNARVEMFTRWVDFVSLVGVDPALAAMPSRYLNLDHGK